MPLNNNSDDEQKRGNLGLDNPNDPFSFDGDDVADDEELHMWSSIIDREFLLNVNVHPSMPTTAISIVTSMAISIVPTMAIPNVPAELGVHEML